jgi:aspartyl-tRNA(Asn)/glutamyl-tRNA(Gln) amidotransferase subunit A
MDLPNQALAGFAGWLGHGHEERAALWAARLQINQPEIELLRTVALPAANAYVAAAAVLEAPDGLPAAGQAAPTEVPDAATALARAGRHPEWHIFTQLADTVPTAAPGFLSGMPVAIKDLMAVRGYPLSYGSGLPAQLQDVDAEVVARIRRAGGAIVGITNLHELAYGITSDNPHFGRVVNPASPSRTAGGSSGGSAAAVAAGIVSAAVGTDTAGSIRVPAACCGVVGFKPGYDVLPRTGVADLAPTLDHVGPIADTVENCAALFGAMLDLPAMPAWRLRDLAGQRIASLGGYFAHPLDPAVRQALDAATQAARADGAQCSECEIEQAAMAPAIQFHTICAEASSVNWDRLQRAPESLGEDVRTRLETGMFMPGYLYVKAQRLRQVLADAMDAAFRDADIMLCATMRAPAPVVGAGVVTIDGIPYPLHSAVTQLTLPFNLTGLPALSLPWTHTPDGVPVCIQIVGRCGADWRVLAVAQRLQALSPWRSAHTAHTGVPHARG